MKVNANPTKEFFISMLTRDIPLDRAILDLVDNSIDAAHEYGDLEEREIRVHLAEDTFEIIDNCGGMDKEIAAKYAFRFGRDPNDDRNTPNSVGQFGVGMKRSLFKLGNNFLVESNHKSGSFKLEVDTNEWLNNEDTDWEFELEEVDEDEIFGTTVSVNNLKTNVSEQFQSNEFVNNLISELSQAHFRPITQGISIYVNNQKVPEYTIHVRLSDDLGGIFIRENYDDVQITIRVGVGDRNFLLGGWYIACNGRLISNAEQSKITLWGVNPLPKYHDKFAFFRGLIEFNCEDSSKLPWTTTKTGVDTDHQVYRYANKLMIDAALPITKFLNDREKERQAVQEERLESATLDQIINDSNLVDIDDIDTNYTEFIRPRMGQPSPSNYTSIRYYVEVDKLEVAKESLGVTTGKEVGEGSFNYYFDYECSE